MSRTEEFPPRAPSDVLDTPEAGGLVVRGGILRVAGFVGGLAFSLIGVALVSRYLGPSLYGRFQTVVSLTMVVAALTDLGMTALGVREYVQRPEEARDRLMRTLLGMRLLLTMVGVAVSTAIVATAQDWGPELVIGTALMGVGLLFTVIQTTLAIPLNAELRLGTVTSIDVVRQGLTALAFAALVAAGAGILPFLAVSIPVHGLLMIWTAGLVGGRVPLRPTFHAEEWASLIRVSIAFALATAVGITYQYIAQILTTFVADPEEAGLFSASFRVFIVAAAIPGLLVSSAFPLMSRAAQNDQARLANAVRGLFEGTLILGAAVAITCVLGAEAIIEIINGPQYAGADGALRIQGAVLLVTFVIATWGFALLALHRHRAMVIANVASLMVTVTVVSFLAASMGAEGAAIGTAVGESTLAVGYLWALTRGRRDLRPPLGSASRSLAAGAAALGTGALLGIDPIVDTAVALLVFGLLLLAFKAVPPELLVLLPEPLRRRLLGR